jgi:hypothetical protein
MMDRAERAARAPSGVEWRTSPSRCPLYPTGIAAPAAAHAFVPVPSLPAWRPASAPGAAVAQTEARYRVSFARARQKRGPPSLSL